jgi:hypothetical protein
VLFATTLLAAPAAVLGDAVFEQELHNQTAASRIGVEFLWPDHSAISDPEVALRVLTEAAESTGSNVLRTSVNTPRSGQKRITHYVLMGRDRSALFDEFTLAEGRWLSRADSNTGAATVSSARAGELSNVGVPVVFGNRYDLTFLPMRQAFGTLPVAGRYYIESDDATADRFLGLVHQRLVESGARDLTVDEFKKGQSRSIVHSDRRLKTLAYVLTGLSTLIIGFILLREGKRIGVLRLLGHSSGRIWYQVAGRLQLAAVLLGLAACAVVALLVPGGGDLFLDTLAVGLAEVAAVGFVITMAVGLVIINRVKVADLIKGRLQ